jgi:uncharacterized protein (UPF0254 family)
MKSSLVFGIINIAQSLRKRVQANVALGRTSLGKIGRGATEVRIGFWQHNHLPGQAA